MVTVKAYGSILLAGAYAVLEEGNSGVVFTIDKGTTTTVHEIAKGITVLLPDFDIKTNGTIKKNSVSFDNDSETLVFVKNAVYYSLLFLRKNDISVKGMQIASRNDAALSSQGMKTGFSSSATATVSTVAAVLKLHGIDDRDTVFKISRFAHYASQGNRGSGYDVSAACYGNQAFVSASIADTFQDFLEKEHAPPKKISFPGHLVPLFIFTGESASTKNCISHLAEYKKNNEENYRIFMKKYNEITRKIIAFDEGFASSLEASWRMRKELGTLAGMDIEREHHRELIAALKENGAVTAGLLGAGGGDSILALCEEAMRGHLAEYIKKEKLPVVDLTIENKPYEIIS